MEWEEYNTKSKVKQSIESVVTREMFHKLLFKELQVELLKMKINGGNISKRLISQILYESHYYNLIRNDYSECFCSECLHHFNLM